MLKVGDYVRTKSGEIAKIDECKGKDKVYKNMEHYETDRMVTKFNNFILYKEDIKKSSPNIIDLIEVGDYVNGYKVLFAGAITWDNDGNVIDKRVEINYDGYDRWLSEDFIKSIVTREQFESMEYKVGE